MRADGGDRCDNTGRQCGDAEWDTGQSYDAFLTQLAEASGLSTRTRAGLGRFDRTRDKRGSNADWTHPHDPDVKIAKMKDCGTRLAHTAEDAVDLETEATSWNSSVPINDVIRMP